MKFIILAILVISASAVIDVDTPWATASASLTTCLAKSITDFRANVVTDAGTGSTDFANFQMKWEGKHSAESTPSARSNWANYYLTAPEAVTAKWVTEQTPECVLIHTTTVDNFEQYLSLVKACFAALKIIPGNPNFTVANTVADSPTGTNDLFAMIDTCVADAQKVMDSVLRPYYLSKKTRSDCDQLCVEASRVKVTYEEQQLINVWGTKIEACMLNNGSGDNTLSREQDDSLDVGAWECFLHRKLRGNVQGYAFQPVTEASEQSCMNYCMDYEVHSGDRVFKPYKELLDCKQVCTDAYFTTNNLDMKLVVKDYTTGASLLSFSALALVVLLALF